MIKKLNISPNELVRGRIPIITSGHFVPENRYLNTTFIQILYLITIYKINAAAVGAVLINSWKGDCKIRWII